MSDLRHPDDALERELIAYVVGELGAVAREQLEQRLAGDAELRSRVAELSATVLALSKLPHEAWALEEPPPPPALDRATRAPASTSDPRLHSRRRRRPSLLGGRLILRPLTAGAAAAALVAAGVLAGAVIESPSGSPAPRIVATADLMPIEGVDPSARAVFRLASDRTARFEVRDLAPTDSGHIYELWLMDSTSDLVSIATFRVDARGRAKITLTLPVSPSHFRYLDVSLQPLDGTALHSQTSVLRGATPS